ncbi:hypothetical protein BH11ACT2_BH11ACT2_16210 [soil metagenome]
MTVQLRFGLADAVVPVHLDDIAAGAQATAQSVLGRFDEPVDRAEATELEGTFRALAELLVASEADLGFAIVPAPPLIGIFGAIVVRWREAVGDDALELAVDESLSTGGFTLEQPVIAQVDTPLGTATRVNHRWAADPGASSLSGRVKADLAVTDQLVWYWRIEDPAGRDAILTVTSITTDLARTPIANPIVDAFAEAITFDS